MNTPKLQRYTPPGTPDTAEILVVPSGNYVAGGDTLNLSPGNIQDPNAIGLIGLPSSLPATPPSVGGENNLSGYYCQFIEGTTLANGKLQWFAPGGAEVAAGAYPAQITAGQTIIRVPLQ